MDSTKSYLEILVKPRARRDELVGWVGQALKLSVSAPPVEGRANEAITALLARELGLPRSRVSIVSGAGGHRKLVCIEGLSASHMQKAIAEALDKHQ